MFYHYGLNQRNYYARSIHFSKKAAIMTFSVILYCKLVVKFFDLKTITTFTYPQ